MYVSIFALRIQQHRHLFLNNLWACQYQCNIVLLHTLFLYSHTKTHKWLLYWCPELISLYIPAYCFYYSCFVYINCRYIFWEVFCFMIVRLQRLTGFFECRFSQLYHFLTLPVVIPNTKLFINLKKWVLIEKVFFMAFICVFRRLWYRGWLGQHRPCCNTNTRPSFLNIHASERLKNSAVCFKTSTWLSVPCLRFYENLVCKKHRIFIAV